MQNRSAVADADSLAPFEEFAGFNRQYYSSTFLRLQLTGLPLGHLNLAALAGGFVWAALRANWFLFWAGLIVDLVAAANAALAYRYALAATQAATDSQDFLIPHHENWSDAHLIAAAATFVLGRLVLGALADRLYYRQYTRWRIKPSSGASGLRLVRLVAAALIVALIAPLTLYRASQFAPDEHSCAELAQQIREGGTAESKERFDCWMISEFPTLFWFEPLPEVSYPRNEDGTRITLILEPEENRPVNLNTFVSALIDRGIDYLEAFHGHLFGGVAAFLQVLLNGIEAVFVGTPWIVTAALLVGIVARLAGPRPAIFVGASLAYLAVFGFWQAAMGTISLVVTSTLLCAAIGFPLGLWVGKSRLGTALATPVLDFLQTIPSFLYLLPAVLFFSFGNPSGIFATVIFAMPPMVRLTASGIRQVPESLKEAALAFGASPRQLLAKVEIPLAVPSILAGIRQVVMMSLSMVVIAAVIGTEGMGAIVVDALDRTGIGRGILAGIGIALIALAVDRVTRNSRKFRP